MTRLWCITVSKCEQLWPYETFAKICLRCKGCYYIISRLVECANRQSLSFWCAGYTKKEKHNTFNTPLLNLIHCSTTLLSIKKSVHFRNLGNYYHSYIKVSDVTVAFSLGTQIDFVYCSTYNWIRSTKSIASSTANNSAMVELLECLVFSFKNIGIKLHCPSNNTTPVWLLISFCIAYYQ